MTKLILFAAFCLALQGCVGLVVPKTTTKVITDPAVYVSPGTDYICSRSAPSRTDEWFTPGVTNSRYTSQCTSEWLQEYWGSPSHVRRASGASEEIWTYNFDRAWDGVVPFVIIPVPLMLPVAREKVCFRLHDSHVVSASVTRSWVVGGTFGFIPNPEGGGTFGAWNWEDSLK